MNLQQMRNFVREQLDLDPDDLPDTLLDVYLQEGYDRTIELESRWPFFETVWVMDVDLNGDTLMPFDSRFIELLVRRDGILLRRITPRLAVLSFPPSSSASAPVYWTRLNRSIRVYPKPTALTSLDAVGYRLGSDWIAVGASGECDCDRRLHIPICWYACSLGYAQQEDEILELTYLNRYKEGAGLARDAIMKPNQAAPRQVSYVSYPTQPGGPGGPAQLVFVLPTP